MYIAHVNDITNPLEFHLNIPAGEKIPRIGVVVFASTDNGYHGKRAKITQIVKVTKFHASTNLFSCPPFISVDYIGELID